MHSFDNQKYIGFFLIMLLVGLTLIINISRQNQNGDAKASQPSTKTFTGTGMHGRNPSMHASYSGVKANAMIPIPQLDRYPIPPLTIDDIRNYVLSGTKGGTATIDGTEDPKYMDPNSRFANAGVNEFDAIVALNYYYQLKGHIAYRDVIFNFPDDNVTDIANNIASGSAVQLRTEEADTLLRVAVIYKGDLCGFGVYNNPAMKQLLLKWGRPDLAGEPGVGETDIESIALVAQAIDEEPDQETRREWLAEIYDFYDNLHPQSPSGAVPQLREYQCAIDIVKDGTFDRLVDNFVKGIKTDNIINPTPGGVGYPFLAPLTTPGAITPTFAPLGGGTPSPQITDVPTQEQQVSPQPTASPVVVVVTATPVPQSQQDNPFPSGGGSGGGFFGILLGILLGLLGGLLGGGGFL